MPEPEHFDVIVLAGGRIDGVFANQAKTTVKALAPLGGQTALSVLLAALSQCPLLDKACVVGPQEIAMHLSQRCVYVPDQGSAPRNVMAALDRCNSAATRVLICASDTPMLTLRGVADLLLRVAAIDVDLAIPLVSADAFKAAYPGAPATFVRLANGGFTIGSQMIARKQALSDNIPVFERMFSRRKSQLAMAGMLGAGFIVRLLSGRLTVADIEAKIGSLTDCRCAAIPDCLPELAYDFDTVEEWRDASKRVPPALATPFVPRLPGTYL